MLLVLFSFSLTPMSGAQTYSYSVNPMHQSTTKTYAEGKICSDNPAVTTIKYVFRNPYGTVTGTFQFPPHDGCVLWYMIVQPAFGRWTVTGIFYHQGMILDKVKGTVIHSQR